MIRGLHSAGNTDCHKHYGRDVECGLFHDGRAGRQGPVEKRVTRYSSYMKLARTGAIRDGRPWAIEFDVANRRYLIFNNSGETLGSEDWSDGDETLYRRINLPEQVTYGSGQGMRPGGSSLPGDGVSFSANRVVFNPNGTSESGTVYLSDAGGETFAVSSLATTGRVKIWTNYGSGWLD